jgi:UDP-glucose 4-epimerase
MATYLVTGGCGFIGSHLVEMLVGRGDKVVVVDDLSTGKRDNISVDAEVIIADIRDQDLMESVIKRVDGCFHLAAVASVEKSVAEWSKTHTINLSAAIGIFELASRYKKPVVYASSAAVYGDVASIPIEEKSDLLPQSPYAADKYGCELHAAVANELHQLPILGFRFFNVYGPRQDPSSPYSGVISIFLDRVLSGRQMTIYGDGTQTRDFVYVGDVVSTLIKGMDAKSSEESPSSEVYNICTGTETSIVELAELIQEIGDASQPCNFEYDHPVYIQRSLGNPNAYRNRLGVSGNVALRDGLQQTLDSLK